MLGVVDREIFHATAFIGRADETLALVVVVPMAERLTLFVELVRIEMEALELAIEAKLCLKVGLRYARASIREMALEVLEHLATRHLQVDMIACRIEVNLSPLIDALAHLLSQCAKHDIVHWRKNTALSLACPS